MLLNIQSEGCVLYDGQVHPPKASHHDHLAVQGNLAETLGQPKAVVHQGNVKERRRPLRVEIEHLPQHYLLKRAIFAKVKELLHIKEKARPLAHPLIFQKLKRVIENVHQVRVRRLAVAQATPQEHKDIDGKVKNFVRPLHTKVAIEYKVLEHE